MIDSCSKCGTPLVEGGVRVDKTVGCSNCTCGFINPKLIQFQLTGRWDDLDEIDTPRKLKDHLLEMAMGCVIVMPGTLDQENPPLAPDQGNPLEHFGEYLKTYAPLCLAGQFTICGIDTAANSYPSQDEIAFDKQGNPLTIEVKSDMSAFDITVAMVAIADSVFDGFPHHCYFEGLDIDPEARTLTFSMGS